MRAFIFLITICIVFATQAQILQKPSAYDISQAPLWAQEMYAANPNVNRVDSLYDEYYQTNPFVKNYHTQYYKRWKRSINGFVSDNGFVLQPGADALHSFSNDAFNKRQALQNERAGNWTSIGPTQVKNNNNEAISEQTNVYCVSQSETQPLVLYCGTEPGEIFKSTDGGQHWICVSENVSITSGVTAICISPLNADRVYAGTGNALYRSTDGGATWTTLISQSGLNVAEILVHPDNDQIILAGGSTGLLRSHDGGNTFSTIISKACYDIKTRPGSGNIVYALCGNSTSNLAEFHLSSDTAQSFTIQTNGWFTSVDPNRNDGGGRLAVSADDPLRVYAYLIGEAKANDYGFIGVFRSDDGGITWTLPNGPAGGPYTASHPNLAYGTTGWTYHQGFYNCAIIASKNDADKILIGGLNCWKSDDGGATFSSVAGYVGGPLNMHVDMQDFRETPFETWITTDGGIYRSDDFFQTQPEVLNLGIRGSEYWGYGQGWNEDFSVGGLYHNGVISHFENYGAGTALQLGGAEPASGYANPGPGRKVLSSEVGGRMLPATIGNTMGSFSVAMFPNESYWVAESSEMEWSPECYNTVWLGRDHHLYVSQDNGTSFQQVYSFGTNASSKLQHIEISSQNPTTMYVSQRPASGSTGKVFKTSDGGQTWTQLSIPTGNSSRILLSLDPVNDMVLYMAYPSGSNGNKVFMTENGGQSWINLTTAELDNEGVRAIVTVPNAEQGVYLFTYYNVFYRDSTMTYWSTDAAGLPVVVNTMSARPFFRDGKIRLATYGKGIWEKPFNIHPSAPVARIMVDKTIAKPFCSADTFFFDDYSIVNHAGASWSWTFENGNPATSSLRNPAVVFPGPGTYEVTLTVTDSSGHSDSDSLWVEVQAYVPLAVVQENFENGFLPYNWMNNAGTTGGNWTLSGNAGGYSQSSHSALFDNYNYDAQGSWSDMYAAWDLTVITETFLRFDVAHSRYGGQYSDTLEVRASTDCGATWQLLYRKGGDELSTAPSITDSLFVPDAGQWRTDSVDLSSYEGQSSVIIAFRNLGHWGQGIYVDNIRLGNATALNEMNPNTHIYLYPNPVVAGTELFISAAQNTPCRLTLFDQQGKQVLFAQTEGAAQVSIAHLQAGTYFYELFSESSFYRGKLVVINQR